MTTAWVAVGLALLIGGLYGLAALRSWLRQPDGIDAEVAGILAGWDADVALADLIADEPVWAGRSGTPVSDAHLLLIADITGVRR